MTGFRFSTLLKLSGKIPATISASTGRAKPGFGTDRFFQFPHGVSSTVDQVPVGAHFGPVVYGTSGIIGGAHLRQLGRRDLAVADQILKHQVLPILRNPVSHLGYRVSSGLLRQRFHDGRRPPEAGGWRPILRKTTCPNTRYSFIGAILFWRKVLDIYATGIPRRPLWD